MSPVCIRIFGEANVEIEQSHPRWAQFQPILDAHMSCSPDLKPLPQNLALIKCQDLQAALLSWVDSLAIADARAQIMILIFSIGRLYP